jgi:hypothetical protein
LSEGPDSKCIRGKTSDEAEAHIKATADNKVGDDPVKLEDNGAPPSLSKGSKEVLSEIAREKRERKATKADDAVVPEFLWEEHLLEDCPTPWVLVERTRLRRAILLLRTRMLKWWKRRVGRSFLAWLKREYPPEKRVSRAQGGRRK